MSPQVDPSSPNESHKSDSPRSDLNDQEIKQPRVGHVYSVKRLDGEWWSAEVLETRVNETKSKRVEYFVHFENRKISKNFNSINLYFLFFS